MRCWQHHGNQGEGRCSECRRHWPPEWSACTCTRTRPICDGLCTLIESAFQRDGIAIWMRRLECGTFQRPALTPDGTHAVLDATDVREKRLRRVCAIVDPGDASVEGRFQ